MSSAQTGVLSPEGWPVTPRCDPLPSPEWEPLSQRVSSDRQLTVFDRRPTAFDRI